MLIIKLSTFFQELYFYKNWTLGLLPNRGATDKIMLRCAGGWFWPSQSDEIDYKSEDLMEKDISYPVPVNRKGTYKFPCSVKN